MDFKQIKIIERKVKYPRLELKIGTPVLILPRGSGFNPTAIIEKHQSWIKQKLEFIEKIKNKYRNQRIYLRSENDLRRLIIRFINEYSIILRKKPNEIKFRYMKTRWGSCSKHGRLSFNLMMKYLNLTLIRYIVFHELTHLVIPNHKKDFWLYIEKEYKDHNQYEEKLFSYWFSLNSQQKVEELIEEKMRNARYKSK